MMVDIESSDGYRLGFSGAIYRSQPVHCEIEMGKNPHCSGSVRFGSNMPLILHCKIAYTTEENVVLFSLKCIEIM